MSDDYDNTSKAEWNADAIELSVVFSIKLEVSQNLDKWNLEQAYWRLRAFRRELDAILTRRKKKIVEEFEKEHNREIALEKNLIDGGIQTVTNERALWKEDTSDEEKKIKFYNCLEEFYMTLCHIMKQHGLYFREGNDFGFAAGRR
jgi:hypothetical protein